MFQSAQTMEQDQLSITQTTNNINKLMYRVLLQYVVREWSAICEVGEDLYHGI